MIEKDGIQKTMEKKKKTIRFYVTIFAMKTLTKCLRLIGKRGTHLPGNIAIHMCKDFLGQIDKPPVVIGITGTNGKTTVSNMINDVLTDNGYAVAGNKFGGNIDAGVAAALMEASTWTGKTTKEVAVLEIDERMTPYILPYVKPDYLIVTNLFRDSYKRNAHSEFIVSILNKQIPDTSKLILNGEDLISNHLKPNNDRVIFGIACPDTRSTPTNNIIQDMVVCPECDTPLEYEYIRYNHIGRAHCPNCGYGSPDIDYAVTGIDYDARRITVKTPNGEEQYKLMGDNVTDIYNTLTAVTLLRTFGLSAEQIQSSLEKEKIVESRFEDIRIGGKRLVMNLAKGQNPIACSRVFDFVRHEPGNKAVLLVYDDFFDALSTTENIAWFYDTDYEFLNQDDVKQVIAGGPRSKDQVVRLLMAGIPEEKIKRCDKEVDTPALVDWTQVDTVFVLHDIYTYDFAQTIKAKFKEQMEQGGK